jgi:hypothetical protein
MSRLSRIAIATAIFMCPSAGALLAQSTPSTGTPAATAPAATPEPTASPTATTDKDTGTAKKKPAKSAKRMTRQQEIDRSIDNGTVPSRYRKDVPKEYQQYVPFEK